MQGDALQERLGARAGGHEPVSAAMLVRVALLVGQAFEVTGVFDLPTAFPRALMHRDLIVAVQHADYEVRSDERERRLGQGMRDGIIVSVEADVGCFSRSNDTDGVTIEAVGRQRQEARALLGEREWRPYAFRRPLERCERERRARSNRRAVR